MIKINKDIILDENELKLRFIKSSGPGGQNINKVSTAVQLTLDIKKSPSIPDFYKEILLKNVGKKISKEGLLIILAKRYRSQERNKQDAINRLIIFLKKCVATKKKRIKTYPTKASGEARVQQKKKKSQKKELRKAIKTNIE